MSNTQLEINNIVANTGNITTIICTSGTINSNLTIGLNNLTSTNVLNIINSSKLYLWSNFR